MGDAAAAAIEERKFLIYFGNFAKFAQEQLGELGELVLATGQSTAVDHQKCQKCRKTVRSEKVSQERN